MAKRTVVTMVICTAVLAGCGGGGDAAEDGSVAPPPSASTATAGCEELADELIGHLQVIIDQLSDATLEDLVQDDLLSEESQRELDDVESRVEEAGCDDDEIDRLLAERADRIEGDGLIAEEIREALSESGDLPF